MIRCALLVLCFLSLSSAALSQAPAQCTWESAQPVSVRTLERAPSRWIGACVRVRGELDYRSLSQTRRARMTVIQTTSIGAYFANPAMHDVAGRWSRPRRVEALGTVGHCRNICSQADAAADAAIEQGAETVTICMPAGWCHYYDDPYVLIDSIR